MRMISKFVLFCVVAVVAIVPAALAATGPSVQGYGGKSAVQSGLGQAPATPPVATPPVATASSGETLPFTGLDLGLLVAGALILLVVGIGLRRVTRSRT